MHRRGVNWSGVALVLLLAPAAWAAEKLETTLPDETPLAESPLPADMPLPGATPKAETKSPPAAAAPQAKLVIGDAYTLEVKRGEVAKPFSGNLLKATDKWIVLRRMSAGRNDYGVPLLSALPKVGNVFRRSYESLVEDDLWIPREAATIVSHRHVTTAATQSGVGNEPPARSRCAVSLAQGEKFVRVEGELTGLSDDKVTVLMMGTFHSQYRHQLARADVLCISIPVVLSNVRMTERDSSQARR